MLSLAWPQPRFPSPRSACSTRCAIASGSSTTASAPSRRIVDWIKRFILFHGKRHPIDLGASEVEAFLTDLAVDGNVAASTQNQARSALLFLYKDVLGIELPWLDGVEHARTPARLPVVLTRDEVARVLRELRGTHALIGALLYGSGMRIMECVRLRVKDVDFERREIVVRDGKGAKDRVTLLPGGVIVPLRQHLHDACVDCIERDLAAGFGAVYLPHALHRKFPDAPRAWGWQYVFPAPDRSTDPRSGIDAAPSPERPGVPARDAPGGPRCGPRQAGHAAHVAPFVRDALAANPVTTSAPCRSSSVIPTSARR